MRSFPFIVVATVLLAVAPFGSAGDDNGKDAGAPKESVRDAVLKELREREKKLEKENEKDKEDAPKAVQAQAAAGAVMMQRGPSYDVPEKVDANDPLIRLLLITPTGPLAIDAAVTIDGKPFRHHREQMIDERMKLADTDGDGKATWAEAAANLRFFAGRYGWSGGGVNIRVNPNQQPNEEQVRQQYIRQYDTNSDGVVDRVEVRRMLAALHGGPALTVQAANAYSNPASQASAVMGLLDTNGDAVLSADEMDAAEARLKSRDADDNDVLEAAELVGNAGRAFGLNRVVVRGGQPGAANAAAALVYQIADATDFSALHSALIGHYGDGEQLKASAFAMHPALFAQLDADKDGVVKVEELAALAKVEAHVSVALNFGETGDLPAGLSIKTIANDLKLRKEAGVSGDTASLELAGVIVHLAQTNPPGYSYNYEANAANMLRVYDKDKNGYIEEKEVEGQQAAYLTRMFETWDEDGDGKVYAKEIAASYERMQAPMMHRVTVAAAEQGNALFNILDTNGDGRLGLREMRRAAQQLHAADANDDKQLTAEELPGIVRLSVARGAYAGAYGAAFQRVGAGRPANAPARADGPEWFTRMDRNGDGDVTLREFIGDAEQFKKLDADGDGFITPAEARQAD